MTDPPSIHEHDTHVRRQATRLVNHIRRHVLRTPGTRAALRRAVGCLPGDPRTFAAHAHVAPFLPDDHPDPATERAFLGVAAIMCAQPRLGRDTDTHHAEAAEPGDLTVAPDDPSDTTPSTAAPDHDEDRDAGDEARDTAAARPALVSSLGATLAYAVNRKIVAEATVERHLHRICHGDSLAAHRQLPRLMMRIRRFEIPVDWVSLICDLALWDRHRARIAATWLRDFYRPLPQLNPPTTANTTDPDHIDTDTDTPADTPTKDSPVD